MLRQPLDSCSWFVRPVNDTAIVPGSVGTDPIPARVPGCVHTALMAAGKIDDPYLDRNERLVQWIGECDWQYRCTFDADPQLFDHERIDLVCDGLDTVATVELNGALVGRSMNLHHPHRFDVRRALRKGANELVITFTSAVRYAREMERKIGPLAYVNGSAGPFNFIRKMACNFGWDWGPALVTCGIWKGLQLEAWRGARIRRVRTRFEPPDVLSLQLLFEPRFRMARVKESLELPNGQIIRESSGAWHDDPGSWEWLYELEQPELWQPQGYGSQPLYTLRGTLNNQDFSVRTGLRTVELDSHPDDIGRGFALKVNGKPIYCKGWNWIPDDCFLDRACTRERYRARLQQALDCNSNMLRVWGGGIYETDEFYDLCDEMGILVWQDFLFACAGYPEEEPFRSSVEVEARHNVARLSTHPSLVLWNGCNENVWGYRDWGWQDKMKDQPEKRTWGAGYYFDLLPKIVKEVDPSRPYWAASPWSGDPDYENGIHPNAATHGNVHFWQVWHGKGEYTNYRDLVPRFCSEFGYQGPANPATVRRAIPEDQLRRGSEALAQHQKSPGGNERADKLLALHFDIPDDFDGWQFLLQLNQARALQTGVEWFRSRQPTCMGALIWQLNDCWPVTSWSAIDGDGRRKLFWYAARRFFAPRLLTIQPEGDRLALFANNDSDERWSGRARVRRLRLDGGTLAEERFTFEVEPRVNARVALLPEAASRASDAFAELLLAEAGEARAWWTFEVDKNIRYSAPKFDATLDRSGDSWKLSITARSFLRDVCIIADRIAPDAEVSDQIVTLLPGESFTFDIRTTQTLTRDQLIAPPVYQCVNRFGRRA